MIVEVPWTENPAVLLHRRVILAMAAGETEAVEIAHALSADPREVADVFDTLISRGLAGAFPGRASSSYTEDAGLKADGRALVSMWKAARTPAAVKRACTAAMLSWLDANDGTTFAGTDAFHADVRADELGAFLDSDAVHGHRLWVLYSLAAWTGLRRGEVCGLRWVDVDLDAARLHVRHQATQVGHDVVFGPPKTSSGFREVRLTPDLVADLRAWRAQQAAERLAWGEAYTDVHGLVFTHENGAHVHPETVTKTFTRLITAAGLRRVKFHDLRHGAGSLWLAGGADIAVVSKMLGHSSIAITADTYSHLIGDVAARTMDAAVALVPRRERTAAGS